MNIQNRIAALRKQMREKLVDTVILTKFDPHQSEYSPAHWNGVWFISGFTGSAGTVVVTETEAGLWTDGRYYIQAARQIEPAGLTLHRASEPGVKDCWIYARDITPEGGAIAFDGRTVSMEQGQKLEEMCGRKKIRLVEDVDWIAPLWDDRPPPEANPVYDYDVRYCGMGRKEKLAVFRGKMKEEGADVYVLSSTDDIAWLFNLRGGDMPYVVSFASFAVVDTERAAVFIRGGITDSVREALRGDGVSLYEYEELGTVLDGIGKEKSVFLNPQRIHYSLYKKLSGMSVCERKPDISSEMKAVKNSVEIANLETVNVRDGVAMLRFIKWLKENVGRSRITECSAAQKLEEFRGNGENYVSPSFETIAGYGANAAMVHYAAEESACADLEPKGMLLVDSGGHYYDGSTDITRTVVLGPLTDAMKTDFTLVLKAHIAMAQTVFLYGATGSHIDYAARAPLWSRGLDYKHGTGHGLGFFLGIHEGPQTIGQNINTTRLEPGMIVTNEPGLYRKDAYGIRTENTLCIEPQQETEFGRFLRFRTISYCPIDRRGIDPDLLSSGELDWINRYHWMVYEKLSPYLDQEEKKFLQNETEAL